MIPRYVVLSLAFLVGLTAVAVALVVVYNDQQKPVLTIRMRDVLFGVECDDQMVMAKQDKLMNYV